MRAESSSKKKVLHTKIRSNGLIEIPRGSNVRVGQKLFVQIKNGEIHLTAKPAGPLLGKRRLSLRVRRVRSAFNCLKKSA